MFVDCPANQWEKVVLHCLPSYIHVCIISQCMYQLIPNKCVCVCMFCCFKILISKSDR